jgi:hypothetical protein
VSKFLQKSFDVYNKRYHNNEIPPTKVIFGKTTRGADGNYIPARALIVIDEDLKGHEALCMICLHHEMAHAKLEATYRGGTTTEDPHHGMIYQAELVRLFHAGAYDGLL